MFRHLPPLTALRAFEAAARHESFKAAAAELNVTPAAVSHQIKGLEELFGIPLFHRRTRALVLSAHGRRVLPLATEGFDKLGEVAALLRNAKAKQEITISVSPSFGALWLVPRLDGFRRLVPDVDIRIDGTDRLLNIARGEADIAIRYGPGGYADVRTDLLFHQFNTPVCSPELLLGPDALTTPADLAHHTLLHVTWRDVEASWRTWLLAAGVTGVDAAVGPQFSTESMALEAAMQGQGVALLGDRIVADHLRAGRLARPFESSLRTDLKLAFHVLTPRDLPQGSPVERLRHWLIDQATQDGQSLTVEGPAP